MRVYVRFVRHTAVDGRPELDDRRLADEGGPPVVRRVYNGAPPCAVCVRKLTDRPAPGWYVCEPCLRLEGWLW